MTTANSVSKRNNFASSDRVAWGGGGFAARDCGQFKAQRKRTQALSDTTEEQNTTLFTTDEAAAGQGHC